MDIITVASILAGIVASITLYKFAMPVVRKLWGKMFGQNKILEKLDLLDACIIDIKTELAPNGGTSMRDSINRIEKSVIFSNGRQKAVLDDSKTATFETDCDGNCTYANRAYLLLVGRPYTEIEGMGWVNALHSRDKSLVIYEWDKAVKDNRNFEMSYSFETPEGEEKQITCKAHRLGDNKTLGYIGFINPHTQ